MLLHKLRLNKLQQGFTIVELTVVIVLIGILSTGIYVFISGSFNQYLALHADSSSLGDVAYQSQRVANVLRGATDITQATSNEVELYAYFVPKDAFVSQIRYYKTADGKKLLADVTPMTANPPTGTPITAQMQTYTVIDNFHTAAGVNTFVYLDSAGADLSMPISDLHTIKGIRLTLASPTYAPSATGSNTVTLSVSLRNRKTNL